LSTLYLNQENPAQGESLLRRAIAIQEREFGMGSEKAADAHAEMARFYRWSERPDNAIGEYERAIAIRELIGKGSTPESARLQESLADMNIEIGDFEAAKTSLLAARNIWATTMGESHPKVAEIDLKLQELSMH
jgi:tetratricopeptide (TPR) repeat protein